MDQRFLAGCSTLVVLWFGACNVYDSSLITGGDEGPGSGGTLSSGGNAGDASGSAGTSPSTGGSAAGGTSPEGGEGGDEGSTGGNTTGGNTTGGNTTGGNTTGGSAGNGSGGTSGASGSAGSAGTGMGGASGNGGAAGASAGVGGAGSSGMAGGGAGGAAGSGGSGGAGGSAGGAVVQLMGTATADSSQTNPMHPASHGNDNMVSTRWCAANGAAGHYWTLDLGAVHPLSRFEVMWEYPTQAAGLPYRYVISISDDGTTFTEVINHSTSTDTMQLQVSDFPPSTNGRHVRITVTTLPPSTPQATWASFFEARVFGQ